MNQTSSSTLDICEKQWSELILLSLGSTKAETLKEISGLIVDMLASILDGDYISSTRPMFMRTKSMMGLKIHELDDISAKLRTLNIDTGILPPSNTRLSLKNIAEVFSQLIELSEAAYAKSSSCEVLKLQVIDYFITETETFDTALESIVQKVRKDFQPYLYGYYFHGSAASHTMTGFSDVDTLAIISKETLVCPEKLLELFYLGPGLGKLLSQRDWFQHHGNYWMTEYDLSHFNSAILPACVLEEACVVCGPANLKVNSIFETISSARTLWASIQWIRRNQIVNSGEIANMYWLKHFLGAILLIPSLVLQINDIWVSKSRSFELAKCYFSINAWRAIEAATQLRLCWSMYVSDIKRTFFEKVVSTILVSRKVFEQTVARWAPNIPGNLRSSSPFSELRTGLPHLLHESLYHLYNWAVDY